MKCPNCRYTDESYHGKGGTYIHGAKVDNGPFWELPTYLARVRGGRKEWARASGCPNCGALFIHG